MCKPAARAIRTVSAGSGGAPDDEPAGTRAVEAPGLGVDRLEQCWSISA